MGKSVTTKLTYAKPHVTTRARELVHDYLAAMQSGTDFLNNGPSLSKRMLSIGVEVIPALLESLDSSDNRHRLYAAGMMPLLIESYQDEIPEVARQRADMILLETFSGGDDLIKREACGMFLASKAIPEVIILPLRELLKSSDSFLTVLAAAVLSRSDGHELDAIRHLTITLQNKNDVRAGIAGAALLRMGINKTASIKAVLNRLPHMNYEGQYCILRAARDLGPKGIKLLDSIVGILKDKNASHSIRQMAAHAIGSISQGSKMGEALLMKMLRSPNWVIVMGALQGLEVAGSLPEEVVDYMIPLLSHPDPEMRETGALGIWMMKARAAASVPVLISQLKIEPSKNVCEAFTKALIGTGEAAYPPLIAFLQEEYTDKMVYALEALASTGPSGVQRLAELLHKVSDERLKRMLLMGFAGIGIHAEPALPVLIDIVDQECDDDLVLYAVMAIHHCGARASIAIPALVRCIADRGYQSDIGRCAILALCSFPDKAVSEIQEQLVRAQGLNREHLAYALTHLKGVGGSRISQFDQAKPGDLERFVFAGNILEKHSKPMGWRTVAEELNRLSASGEICLGDYGTSPRMLSMVFQALSELWNTRLTTHTNRRKGELTVDGRRLLQEARLHLSRKHAQGNADRTSQSR